MEPLRTAPGGGPTSRALLSAHNLLMKGHAAAGDAAGARRVFAALRARGLEPDAVSYNSLLSAFVEAGELLRARAVLDKMRREGVAPDAWSYSILARGLGEAGRAAELPALRQEMGDVGLQPDTVCVWAAASARLACVPCLH